jgi:hypothetical protein
MGAASVVATILACVINDMSIAEGVFMDSNRKFCEAQEGYVTQEYCTYVCPEKRSLYWTKTWNSIHR